MYSPHIWVETASKDVIYKIEIFNGSKGHRGRNKKKIFKKI